MIEAFHTPARHYFTNTLKADRVVFVRVQADIKGHAIWLRIELSVTVTEEMPRPVMLGAPRAVRVMAQEDLLLVDAEVEHVMRRLDVREELRVAGVELPQRIIVVAPNHVQLHLEPGDEVDEVLPPTLESHITEKEKSYLRPQGVYALDNGLVMFHDGSKRGTIANHDSGVTNVEVG